LRAAWGRIKELLIIRTKEVTQRAQTFLPSGVDTCLHQAEAGREDTEGDTEIF
jgi:hypothetical protein